MKCVNKIQASVCWKVQRAPAPEKLWRAMENSGAHVAAARSSMDLGAGQSNLKTIRLKF